MRMSAYPRAFSLYPNWLKPVLLSLGAMFIVTALFLMILIWKSAPSAAAVQMSAVASAPAMQPGTPTPAPMPSITPVPSRGEVPAAAAPVAHKSAKHHKVAHAKKARHAKHSRTKVAKRSSGKDPLLDLLR
jgi:hypothetical protein